jgi:hypothetical protein
MSKDDETEENIDWSILKQILGGDVSSEDSLSRIKFTMQKLFYNQQ